MRSARSTALRAATVAATTIAALAGPMAAVALAAKPPAKPSIDSGPAALTRETAASIAFSSAEAGVTFECALDSTTYAACVSPVGYTALAEGAHAFRVRAVNASGTSAATQHQWTIDVTAPAPAVYTATPPNPTSSTSASLAFASPEAGVTYNCSLDGAAPASCASPVGLTALAEGAHSFSVVALDAAGNASAPALAAWTVDFTAPATPLFVSGPAARTNATSATLEFSAEPGAVFTCSLDGAQPAACASPYAVTGPLLEGAHQVSVVAVDAASNASLPATHEWTVDLTAPAPPVVTGPASPTNATGATFTVTGEEGATLACSLDGGAWAGCPTSLSDLAEGQHSLEAVATDAAGNPSAPTTWAWTVDVTPPAVPAITGAPEGETNATTASIAVTGDAADTLACEFDGALVDCATLAALADLAEGPHELTATATDAAGNTASAAAAWVVDVTVPVVPSISTGPAAATNATVAEIVFAHEEEGVAFTCVLDGTPAACASPAAYDGLAAGSHEFAVTATDAAGNTSPPASHAWTVDLTAPGAPVISAGPAALTNDSNAAFTITVAEEGDTLECSLDGSAYAGCPAAHSVSGLADGAHALSVVELDAAGNRSAPATWAWRADLVAPGFAVAAPATLGGAVGVSFTEPVAGVPAGTAKLLLAGTTTAVGSIITCRNGAAVGPCTGTVTAVVLAPVAPLMAGQRYAVSLAAGITDLAGNALVPATAPFRASLVEDDSTSGASYRWRVAGAASALGGSYAVEQAAGASVSYVFRGTGVTWFTLTAPNQGTATVYIDGVYKGVVNNYSPAARWRVARSYAGLANTAHRLTIVVRGSRGAAAGTGTQVVVDGFKVGSSISATPPVSFTWRALGTAAAYGGRYLRSDLAGASAQFTFRGTSIAWHTIAAKDMGRAQVFVDGVLKATVDNYSATTVFGVRRLVSGLTDGVHTVRVVALGTRSASATGTGVVVDRWVVG